jgi:recombination protein RecA
VAQNLVEKSGSWYSFKGDRIGQGRENAKQFLKDNGDIRDKIDGELRKTLNLIKANGEAETPSPVVPVAAENGRAASRRT